MTKPTQQSQLTQLNKINIKLKNKILHTDKVVRNLKNKISDMKQTKKHALHNRVAEECPQKYCYIINKMVRCQNMHKTEGLPMLNLMGTLWVPKHFWV